MLELTAGYVAGIIAFGIVLAQILCPTALAFLLAGQLRDRETAATWTVAGRYLHSSLWPTFITSDPAKNRGVRRGVIVTTYALPTLSLIIAIAGIVTPLGLYEINELAGKTTTGTFAYARDSSSFFDGTSPRDNKTFTRVCRYRGLCFTPCPYVPGQIIWATDGLNINCTFEDATNATVPNIVRDIYSSGTSNKQTTISNFFDIEWRQLTTQYDRYLNNGTPVASGVFRQLESSALSDDFRAVEGLIIDGKSGGIGFRNHTIPEGLGLGATWSEELLFIEPDVFCVDNNMTIDFEITSSKANMNSITVTKLVLTDRGGFANINTTNPYNDTYFDKNIPDLRGRAYSTAWFINAYSMMFLNVTNSGNRTTGVRPFQYLDSKIGQEFKLPHEDYNSANFYSLNIAGSFGEHLGISTFSLDPLGFNYPNPWNITGDDFVAMRELCQATGPGATALLNNTYVACNFIRGVPKRVDEGPGTIFESGSHWSAPTYTCASSVRATIKKVSFFHNGTAENLDHLVIRSIEDKNYTRKEDEPLWGIEDWYFRLSEYDPVWGLVDDAYEGFRNVSTIRQPSFYMIGDANYAAGIGVDNLDPQFTKMNIPGAIAPVAAMNSVTMVDYTLDGVPEWVGLNSMSLWLKWANLSSSVDTMPLIIKLIWTDYAASAMVGSKGVLGSRNAHPDEAAVIQIRPMVHRVRYHYAFGVPAYLLLLCVLITAFMVLISVITGQSSVKLVDQRLKQTSIGRVLTTMFYPHTSTFDMKGKEWSSNNGNRELDLGVGTPMPATDAKPAPSVSSGDRSGIYTAVPQPSPGYEDPTQWLQQVPTRKALR